MSKIWMQILTYVLPFVIKWVFKWLEDKADDDGDKLVSDTAKKAALDQVAKVKEKKCGLFKNKECKK